MTTPHLKAAAHLIAKLLARRVTPPDEIAGLIHSVHGALSRLHQDDHQDEEQATVLLPLQAETPTEPPVVARPRRKRREAAPVATPATEEVVPPPVAVAPKLVRRADVVLPPAPTPTPGPIAAPAGATMVRGIVKWFDPRSGKGALRLPGFAGDVALEARHLTESGIARLFKGQEVEATVAGNSHAPLLERLALPGSAAALPIGGGVVHSRRAKPVLVELKREALRRVAARAEAEHLLGPSRPR
jgi:cold shock CspA family protein